MSENKITPGPWASSGVGVVQAENGELICSALFIDGTRYPNAEANMHAIAVLPELVELAHIIRGYFQESGTNTGVFNGTVGVAILQKANETIAKVEGRFEDIRIIEEEL